MTNKDDKRDNARESSGVLTIRLDPKVRYQIELAARLYRSTLSNVMERYIREGLKEATIHPRITVKPKNQSGVSLNSIIDELWDLDPKVRTVKLAIFAPELLNYEEAKIWQVITNIPALWSLKVKKNEFGAVLPPYDLEMLDVELIELHWNLLEKIASDKFSLQDARIKFKEIAIELNRNRKTAPDPAYCWGARDVKRIK